MNRAHNTMLHVMRNDEELSNIRKGVRQGNGHLHKSDRLAISGLLVDREPQTVPWSYKGLSNILIHVAECIPTLNRCSLSLETGLVVDVSPMSGVNLDHTVLCSRMVSDD